jgi:hypothetical protein
MVFAVASCIWPSAAQSESPQPHPSTSAKTTPKPKPTTAAQAQAAKKEAARRAAMMLLAPADEYFGPLKQSILGIRNSLRDMGLRYDANHDIAEQTLHSAELTEASIRDWGRKYPRDHEVATAIFNLQRLYTKIQTETARQKAKSTADWLFRAYDRSPEAKSLRELLVAEQISTPAPAVSPSPGTIVIPPAPDTVPTQGPLIPGPSPAPTSRR